MSSASISLFASIALATVGAASFAYLATHPGIVTGAIGHLLDASDRQAGLTARDDAESEAAKPERPASGTSATETLPAGAYGHFETEAEINGRSIDVMVDTGASTVALTYDDAQRLGIYVKPGDFTHIAQTANGTARVAPVMISRISIGNITVRNVQGVVSERGKSEQSLLGMSFLGRLSRVEMRGGTLVLQE